MAAGQQKKRLNASSVVSCNLQEQYKAKKKKNVESSQNLLNVRAHISLEWDDNQNRAVAKREQIGITRRNLAPFVDSVPHPHAGLADVFAIPQEIFGLEDMTGVLSYEVWEKHLSEMERNLLTQFLPKGTDVEQVVKLLLTGENLHFGNPFLKWGASLCSGNLHPDAVLRQEQCFRDNKKAYHSDLRKYHNDIVENLLQWKERWASCKDPEKDIVQKMWSSSRKHVENSLCSNGNESRSCDPEENLAATAESCFWVAAEKVCSGNKQNTLIMQSGDLQERKGLMKDRSGNSLVASQRPKVAASSRKEENKLYMRSGDGAKYMSYIKLSRKQHQLVKRIKQSGDGIQSKSLNRVLGDIKGFHVQPYEVFEEEECKKLHVHWLQLAKGDLPVAYANWKKSQLQRQQWRRSLEQEMAERKKSIVVEDEEKVNPDSSLQEQRENGETYQDTVDIQNFEDDEESVPQVSHCQPLQRIPSLNGNHECDPMDMESEEGNQDILKPEGAAPILSEALGNMNSAEDAVEQEVTTPSTKESVPHSAHSQLIQRIPSLNSHCELDPMDMEPEGSRGILKSECSAPILSEFLGNMNPSEDAIEQGHVSSAKVVWPAVGMPDSYYHSTSVSYGYTSASELSLKQPRPIEERPARLVDLETDLLQQDDGEALIQRPSNDMGSALHIDNGSSFFGSYTNHDRSELLQPILKGQGMLPSYAHVNKQPGLQFLATSNGSLETGHHPGHFHEQQQQLVEQRQQMKGRDFYMHQVIQKNMYSSGGRYPNPSQELFLPDDVQDWVVDPVRVSAPFQSLLNGGGLLGQNWFSGEHRARGDWSGMDVSSGTPGLCLGKASSADEGLYSVLSQCNKLQSPYDSMRPAEQYVPARNFVGGGIPGNSDVFPHTAHQLNYLSGCEAATLKANNNISWMNVPHQNSDLHDSIGKPFLRSWNQ